MHNGHLLGGGATTGGNARLPSALQLLVGGQKVSSYSEGGEEYDIRLRATAEYRTDEDRMQLLTVPSRKQIGRAHV